MQVLSVVTSCSWSLCQFADSVLHVRPDAILRSCAARNQQYNGVSCLTECFVVQEIMQNIL